MLCAPAPSDLLFRRSFGVSDFQRDCRNTTPDEAVLVTADESVAFGFGIGKDLDTERLADLTEIVSEIRFFQALHNKSAQRKERQEHIYIHVRDDRICRHGRMRSVVFGSEQTFLFGSNGQEED